MKVLLICPSNSLFTPYVKNYTDIYNQYNVNFEIVLWNRFNHEEKVRYQFIDKKIGHKRNFFDYIRFGGFVRNILKSTNYDRVIVFGLQTLFLYREYF